MHFDTSLRAARVCAVHRKQAWPPPWLDCPSAAPGLARKPLWQPRQWEFSSDTRSKHLQIHNL